MISQCSVNFHRLSIWGTWEFSVIIRMRQVCSKFFDHLLEKCIFLTKYHNKCITFCQCISGSLTIILLQVVRPELLYSNIHNEDIVFQEGVFLVYSLDSSQGIHNFEQNPHFFWGWKSHNGSLSKQNIKTNFFKKTPFEYLVSSH